MGIKKRLEMSLRKTVCGVFFVLMGVLMGVNIGVANVEEAYAVPTENETTEVTEGESTNANTGGTDNCQNSLGAIGWLICPTTGKIAEAVDWLYEKIESILILNPVVAKEGEPIYEIWKYFLSFTNIVFVIFFLVVIYAQLTGVGISNYGVKKALPKLIVAAIMVNLSFLLCSIAVDVSNIVGSGLRDVFLQVENSVAGSSEMGMHLSFAEILLAFLGGGVLTVGAGVIAFETGAIWMLIPVVFGAIVAVVVGLVTIALRQAVVVLLIMIAPMAIVACIFPNTEKWFKQWQQLFWRMLIFYPMFSLLFGASSLAGFAIISSAQDGFGLLLGVAVQIFPLFFAWSLMKMSGTFLETINAKLHSIGARPVDASRKMAMGKKELAKAKHLAGPARTPSMRLMQFMANRGVGNEADLGEYRTTIQNRGMAWRANQNYLKGGAPSKRGERRYASQVANTGYQEVVERDKNTFDNGLAYLAAPGTKQRQRLEKLDTDMAKASDSLNTELARGEMIEYRNREGRYRRAQEAMNAHLDMENGFDKVTNAEGQTVLKPKEGYKFHVKPELLAKSEELARYNTMNEIMEGDAAGVQYAVASAAQSLDTQRKILATKQQSHFDSTVPTRDIELKLTELTKAPTAVENIDLIMPGLRTLNTRGDLGIVWNQIDNITNQGLELGTHASQALASFMMFEVKDGDTALRRYGKYLNLETAQIYKNKRTNPYVTIDEYVRGEYQQVNPETGQLEVRKSKMGLPQLLFGTSLDGIEREAMENLDNILKNAYTDGEGNLDIRKYLLRREEVEKAIAPQFISASLKHLSGSDQIKAMVSFLTGYDANGHARWDADGDLASDADFAEKYFRDQTLKYINDQTPNNILGLRSDYYKPLVEHLSKAYAENEDLSDWDEDELAERREYMARLAEIQTRYGDLPAEEANERRREDLQALKSEMAGAEFRRLLDEKGKLDQIYRTRTSSASNSAKDWVRDWLDLNDEEAIRKHLKKRAKHPRPEADAGVVTQGAVTGGFNDADRELFANSVRAIWDKWRYTDNNDVEAFYDQTAKYIRETLSDVGETILRDYEQYHEDNPEATARMLRDELMDLVRNPENY